MQCAVTRHTATSGFKNDTHSFHESINIDNIILSWSIFVWKLTLRAWLFYPPSNGDFSRRSFTCREFNIYKRLKIIVFANVYVCSSIRIYTHDGTHKRAPIWCSAAICIGFISYYLLVKCYLFFSETCHYNK